MPENSPFHPAPLAGFFLPTFSEISGFSFIPVVRVFGTAFHASTSAFSQIIPQ
jgi:hypothetical protein